MIKVLESKPEGIFENLSEFNTWLMGYDIKGIYCYYALEVTHRMGAIHLHILRWTHNVAKRLRSDLETLKLLARNRGANCLVASFPNTEDKIWPRFIKRFGFPEPCKIYMSVLEI